MPIYVYHCKKCDKTHEIIQRMSDKPIEKCECGGDMEKMITSATPHFKGSGFYETEYKKKKR